MNKNETIKYRLYSLLPNGSTFMSEFLKIADIKLVKDKVYTAAVTCELKPVLYINEDFIDNYCKTDEHLLMLVLHELYHIILGHTRLFLTPNKIDNIAFDAIINSMLCKQYPGEEYTSFFKNFYKENKFPELLLRPPGTKLPDKYQDLMNLLYQTNKGTYYEIYQKLCSELEFDFGLIDLEGIKLLGNHDNIDSDIENEVMKEAINRITSKWPKVKDSIGIGQNETVIKKKTNFENIDSENIKKMNILLKKSGVMTGNLAQNKRRPNSSQIDVTLPVINYRDRLAFAKTMIYGTPILFNQSLNIKKIEDGNLKALVYLDVSSSVVDNIGKIFPLLYNPYFKKEIKLFVFSTVVKEIEYDNFINKNYESTGGTDIDCIFEHYFSLNKKIRPKSILILTDGYTQFPNDRYKNLIKKDKVVVNVGYFGSNNDTYLKGITKFTEVFK